MDRKTALKIMDRLTPLGVNVVIVAVADPTYTTLDIADGQPDYQVELSRNNALDGDKITEMIDEIKKLDAYIEFPQMTVVTMEEQEQRQPVPPDQPVEPPVVTDPTDPVVPEPAPEPTDPGTPTPEPVQASPTTDDVVDAGHEDPRES